MRGGRDTDSFIGIEFCSTWYWITTALIVVLLFLFGYLIKMYVTYIQQKKMNCHYFRENVDKIYTWLYYFKMWIAGMAGGLMGGMTGVGSGSLMVPTMIIFEVEPRVASATSGFSKLFISAATVILVYIGMEKINK